MCSRFRNVVAHLNGQQLSPLSRTHNLIHTPARPMFHHVVENREPLSHTGGEYHLLGLSCVTQAWVETANNGIAAGPTRAAMYSAART